MGAKSRRDASYIRDVNNRRDTKNSRNIRNRRLSTTAGSQQQQEHQQQQKRQQQQVNTPGKSATKGRQSTAGTSGVVDNGGKFATGVVDTGGKSSIYQMVANIGNSIRLLTPYSELEEKNIYLQYLWTLLPESVQTKYLKLFYLKVFSICHWCQQDWCCTLSWE